MAGHGASNLGCGRSFGRRCVPEDERVKKAESHGFRYSVRQFLYYFYTVRDFHLNHLPILINTVNILHKDETLWRVDYASKSPVHSSLIPEAIVVGVQSWP